MNAKPKEIRIHICPVCGNTFERLEYVHSDMNKDMACNQKCRGIKSKEKRKLLHPIKIDDIVYNTISEASKTLGIKYYTIVERLKSDEFDNYVFN